MLNDLPRRQQRRLARAMQVIEEVLTRDPLDDMLERLRDRPGHSFRRTVG